PRLMTKAGSKGRHQGGCAAVLAVAIVALLGCGGPSSSRPPRDGAAAEVRDGAAADARDAGGGTGGRDGDTDATDARSDTAPADAAIDADAAPGNDARADTNPTPPTLSRAAGSVSAAVMGRSASYQLRL